MSDEEKKTIENLKTEYEKLIKEDNILFPLYKSDAKRLIDKIEKQSKEIEELKEKNSTLKNLQNDTNRLYIEMIERKNYFEKELQKLEDKIKAKIEEMDNIISQNEGIIFNGRYEHLHTLTEARIVKGEMQSLLEKE